MNIIKVILMIVSFIISFGGGYALGLICKEIKWEVRFCKTATEIDDIEFEGTAPSIDWIIGARWALVELIKKKGDS